MNNSMKKYIVLMLVVMMLASVSVMIMTGCNNANAVEMTYDEEGTYGLYFYGENHSLTNADMLRAKQAVLDKSYFDASRPTIIWIHGWEPTPAKDILNYNDVVLCLGGDTKKNVPNVENVSYPQLFKEAGYNVASFIYCGLGGEDVNYAGDLTKIYNSAFGNFNNTGKSLAYYFASELCMNLKDYKKEITYVGHSCGSFVTMAVNNMVDYFLETKTIKNKNLMASKIFLADPYVNSLADVKISNGVIAITNEAVNDRKKVDIVQDIIIKLNEKYSTPIAVYLGMGMASSSFTQVSKEKYDKVASHSIVVDMKGLKNTYNDTTGIHVITRDWVLSSVLQESVLDQNGNKGPIVSMSRSELQALVGKQYVQTSSQYNIANDSFEEVSTLKA